MSILEELDIEDGFFSFKWYKGHSASSGNILADEQATLALNSQLHPFRLSADLSLLKIRHPRFIKNKFDGYIYSSGLLAQIRKTSGSFYPKVVRVLTGHFRQRFTWSLDDDQEAGVCPICNGPFFNFNHWFNGCINWVDTLMEEIFGKTVDLPEVLHSGQFFELFAFAARLGIEI